MTYRSISKVGWSVLLFAIAGCGGGGGASPAPSTSATSKVPGQPPPTGPITVQFEETQSSAAFGGPVDFTGTGPAAGVTVVVSEPRYDNAFALTLSSACIGGAVNMPANTDANGQAFVYLNASASPFLASAGCSIEATDTYDNTSALPLVLEYTGSTGGADAWATKH